VRRSEVFKLLENVPRVYANQAFAVLTALYKYLDTRCNLRPYPGLKRGRLRDKWLGRVP